MTTIDTRPILPVPSYHAELRSHLESSEPELWAWFGETLRPPAEEVEKAELELLKSSYRLNGDLFDVLSADATLLAGQLELNNDITLYQELHDTGRNARVQIFGDQVHILFGGDLLNLLSPGEQRAVLAHELAHVSLLLREGGVYRVLDALVHRLADDPTAHAAIEETARRLRLHTEVYADALAAQITADTNDLISAIVKVESGLRNVDATAYRHQAEEILVADGSATSAWSHPELHIRVACLAANTAAGPAGADPAVLKSLIEGPDDLDHLDLLAQLRLQTLTEQVLHLGRSAGGQTVDIDTHVRSFTGMKQVTAHLPSDLNDAELASAEPSVRFYAASLLVDLALAADDRSSDLTRSDPAPTESGELHALRRLGSEAERIGIAAEFDKILARATERSLSDVRKLRRSPA